MAHQTVMTLMFEWLTRQVARRFCRQHHGYVHRLARKENVATRLIAYQDAYLVYRLSGDVHMFGRAP